MQKSVVAEGISRPFLGPERKRCSAEAAAAAGQLNQSSLTRR